MMNDILADMLVQYGNEINFLKNEMTLMTALMVFWMIVSIVEYSIIKINKEGKMI